MSPPSPLPASATRRLHALLQARRSMPFAWALRDCAMLPLDWAQLATGKDVGADLRGAYCNALQACRLLRRLGGMRGLASARFGAPVDWADGSDGDVLLLSPDVCTQSRAFGGALGIRWQGQCVGQGARGLVQAPGPGPVLACWRVA